MSNVAVDGSNQATLVPPPHNFNVGANLLNLCVFSTTIGQHTKASTLNMGGGGAGPDNDSSNAATHQVKYCLIDNVNRMYPYCSNNCVTTILRNLLRGIMQNLAK